MIGMIVIAIIAALLLAWYLEYRRRDPHPVADGLQLDIDLPHDEEFELYHNALSICSMKVRVCLAELQIPYKSHHIDLIETGSFETTRASFRRVNPAGTVPVLVHNGHPIYQSHEQIRYAATHCPPGVSPLVPDDRDEAALMDEWIDRSSLTAQPLDNMGASAGNAVPGQTFPLFATMIEKIPYWRIVEGLLFHHNKRMPMLFVALKLKGLEVLGSDAFLSKLFADSRQHLHEHLDALEQQLKKSVGPWIVGTRYTLADVSWLVIFERLKQAAVIDVFVSDDRRPACAAYWRQLQERAAYRTAILDHAHPIVTYGTNRIVEAKAASPALRELLEGVQQP
ncbi:MAG: glutathione S-transferase family protein [Pseudomonadota bacterium]